MSLTNGSWSAAGLSSAMLMTASATAGRRAVRATREDDGRQDEREDQELQAARPHRHRAATAAAPARGIGSEYSGIVSVA